MFRLSGTHELHTKWLQREASRPRVWLYVCMVITYSRVWNCKVANPALVSYTGKMIFPCPRACLIIWSRETGSAVPARVSLFITTVGFSPALYC